MTTRQILDLLGSGRFVERRAFGGVLLDMKQHQPPRRDTDWLDLQPQMNIPQSGGIAAFRVPAGHYAFKVDSFTFGGPDGIDFPAGQLTRLEADAVPVDAGENHE
ncbi:MAG: hypothetical protein QM477_12290 [Planctomycetota bacterium]